MKWVLLTYIFSCSAILTNARPLNDWDGKHLKGKVQQETETTLSSPKFIPYACIMRMPPKPEYQTKFTGNVLDKNGNQIQYSCYNYKHQLVHRFYCSYDANNNKSEAVDKDANGKLISRTVYKYDEKGYLVEKDLYNEHDSLYKIDDLKKIALVSTIKYIYDENGNISAQYSYDDSKPKPKQTTEKIYRFPSRQEDDFADSSLQTLSASYGKNGQLTSITKRELSYDKDNCVKSEEIYRYDDFDKEGNWHCVSHWVVSNEADELFPTLYVYTRELNYFK